MSRVAVSQAEVFRLQHELHCDTTSDLESELELPRTALYLAFRGNFSARTLAQLAAAGARLDRLLIAIP